MLQLTLYQVPVYSALMVVMVLILLVVTVVVVMQDVLLLKQTLILSLALIQLKVDLDQMVLMLVQLVLFS